MTFAAPLLTQTAAKKSLTSYDTANLSKPTYTGAATEFACLVRHQPGRKVMVGARSVSVDFVILTETEIVLTDLVFPPGASTSSNGNGRVPVRVLEQPTFDGGTIYEAEFVQ